MFSFPFNKKAFSKLYRYYCRKLLKQWIIISLMFLFFMLIIALVASGSKKISEVGNWQEYVGKFWIISLSQSFYLFVAFSLLVSKLVSSYQGYSGGFGFGFSRYKKNSAADIKVLTFAPAANRETVILAKFATILTYFFALNLLLTLPVAIYFLFVLSLPLAIFFLLLSGVVFALANFLLFVPFLFYFYEDYSILSFFIFFAIVFVIQFLGTTLRDSISRYPLLLPLIFVPLSVLSGGLFFYLYQKKYLKKDLI